MLETMARWTNEWFQVKKAPEQNKHKAPFEPITDIAELKAYIGVLLAMNQNIDLPWYEHYFRQDESKWLLLTSGFHKVFSEKRFSQLNGYIFLWSEFCKSRQWTKNLPKWSTSWSTCKLHAKLTLTVIKISLLMKPWFPIKENFLSSSGF